jgi:predicted lipoprotein with Yx(FWY)xxD motif
MRSTNMKVATAAVLAAIALAACSSSSKSGSSTTSPPTQAPTTAAPATSGSTGTFTVATATKSVKGSQQKILVDSNGMTLYVNEKDKPGKPACTGSCLTAWPPLTATGTITVAPGLTLSKYTTVTASDGTKQVAVNGSPLYLWMNDKKPADATGQDVGGFYVVMTSGTKYDPGATTGATTGASGS